MSNTIYSQQAHWQREFKITSEWQDKLPSIWQLQKGFSLKVMQCVDPLSPCGERTFLLAHETECHNGVRTIRGLVYLTPAFLSLSQLEKHTREFSVDILHSHFYGDFDLNQGEALIAG